MITLEDDPCDIIGKSMRGQEITLTDLANKTPLSEEQINDALAGNYERETLRTLARALELSEHALISQLEQSSYTSEPTPPSGITCFTSPYGYLGVNAYLITYGKSASLFDTGTDAQPIIDYINEQGLNLENLYITHCHPDHIACINDIRAASPDIKLTYPEDLVHGEVLSIGGGQLVALDVSGHATPAKAYYYDTLAAPVCICGDSLFAGSMGGTTDKLSYQRAIKTAKEHVLTLPESTLICPGHGPLSSVRQELSSNPFL